MRRAPTRLLPFVLAFALGVGAAMLTACGSTNKAMIPAANADALHRDLDAIQSAIDSGKCSSLDNALQQAEADVQQLPNGTSVRLRNRLEEGIRRLKTQAPTACAANTATTQTQPTTTTVVPVTTATTTTTTTPTTTTPTTTTTTTTPTTTTPTTTTTSSDTGGVTTP